MAEVEYVYEKPKAMSHKKLVGILFLAVIIVLSAYFLYTSIIGNNKVYNQTFTVGDQTYTIPSNYKGKEGLEYVRNNYASGLTQAKDFCINDLRGNWIDVQTGIGCYNLQSFSYCSMNTIKSLTDMCNSIEGIPNCNSTQASCEIKG